jgi:hypothetical protein
MGLFSKRKNRVARPAHDTRVDFHAQSRDAKVFARARVRKVYATKVALTLRTFLVVLLSLVFLGGMLGFLGLIGYSLKTGGDLTLSEKIAGFVRTTPLKFLVKESTKVQSAIVVGIDGVPEVSGSTFVFAGYITRVGEYGFLIDTIQLRDRRASPVRLFDEWTECLPASVRY